MTNSLSFLPQADEIMMIEDGQIKEMGSYDDLRRMDGRFMQFIKNFLASNEANREKNGSISILLQIMFS